MPLFTFMRTLRNALPLNEDDETREAVGSSSHTDTDNDGIPVPDEELEGMFPNPPSSGKVRAKLPTCQCY
jgi:hypothetical protein